MATSAAARHELYTELVRVIGPDHAETLMSYLPTDKPERLATKEDLTSVRDEIAALRTDFRDLRSEMTAFRTEIRADFAALSQRVDRMFIAMMGAMAVMIAALVGGIITLD